MIVAGIRVIWGDPENIEGKRGGWSGCPAMRVAHVGAGIVETAVVKVSLPERAVCAEGAIDHVTPFTADQFESNLIVCCGKVGLHFHRTGERADRRAFLWC